MAEITYESKIATGKAIRIAAEQIKKLLMGENGTTILSKWIPGTMDDVIPFNGISTTALEGIASILGGTIVFEIKYDSVNKWFVALDVEGNPYGNWESDEDTHGEYNFSSADAYGEDSTNGRTPYSNKIYYNLEDNKWYRWIGNELRVVGGKDVDLSGIQHTIENLQDEVDAVESQATTNMQNISTLNTNTSKLDTRTTSAENKIAKLMEKNFPTTASCSISPTALQEQGSTAQVTINNFSLTSGGETLTIDKITINGSVIEGTSYTTSITNTTTYTIVLFSGTISKSVTKTVTFVYPIYTGFSSATTVAQVALGNLTKASLRQSIGTLTVTHTNSSPTNYFWIVSPYKVTKVVTSGIEATKDLEEKGQIGSYYYYRLNKAIAADTFTFIIS
jgi:hypothetical protein